jgi:hypothetical protein
MVDRLHQAQLRNPIQGPAEICPPGIKWRPERPRFEKWVLMEKALHSSILPFHVVLQQMVSEFQ